MNVYYPLIVIPIFIIFIITRLKEISKKSETIVCFIFFTVMLFLTCFRKYNVGIDTLQFYQAYGLYSGSNFMEAYSKYRYEFGYALLNYILNRISSDPQTLIIVTSLFINCSVFTFIMKNSNDRLFSLFMFISLNIWFEYQSLMRQAIGISIILLGYNQLLKKGIKHDTWFVISVLLGFLFHKVCILALVLLFFKYLKNFKGFINFWFIGSLLGFFLLTPITEFAISIVPQYNYYLDSEFLTGNRLASYVNLVFIVFLVSYAYYKIRKMLVIILGNNQKMKIGGNTSISYFVVNKQKMTEKQILNCTALIVISAFLFTIRFVIFTRIVSQFLIFIIIYIPKIISYKSKKERKLYSIIIGLVLLTYCSVIMFYRPEWYGIYEYEFFFN